MSATKFVPVELDLIDEGLFLKSINEELKAVMQQMIAFKKQHGSERSQGAKGILTIKVTVQFEGRDEDDFSIKGVITKQTPARPASLSVALQGEEQDGQPTLFVRQSGSSQDNPKQAKLCTKDGRTIDPDTGEVLEDNTDKK